MQCAPETIQIHIITFKTVGNLLIPFGKNKTKKNDPTFEVVVLWSCVLSADKFPAKYDSPCQNLWYFWIVSYLQPFHVHEILMFCRF